MRGVTVCLAIFLLFYGINAQAETFRTIVEDTIEVTPERPSGSTTSIGINSSVYITLGEEARFLRGIEIEITAPQTWLSYRGALVMAIYNNVSPQTAEGITEITGTQIAFDPFPGRLQIIYQIPVRQSHGLRTTTSVTVPSGVAPLSSFPLLFRMMPVIKGLSNEFENLTFSFTARPILSDEGAVRLIPRYPPQLRDRQFTVLIDDNVVDISEQIILREGEHHLVILSDEYRNESRRFIVERAKVLDLILELQDPTPVINFEAPANAQVYLNNAIIPANSGPVMVAPGQHEVRFQVGDYTVIRTLNIQRGKTYRVALEVDLIIHEEN